MTEEDHRGMERERPVRSVTARTATGVAVLGIGAIATIVVARAHAMPGRDTVELVGLAAGAALGAAALGVVGLYLLRRRSVGAQTSVVALVAVASCAGGAWGAARAMFLSSHDAAVLDVMLVASTTVALVLAVALGMRVSRAGERLAERARTIGHGVGVFGDAERPRAGTPVGPSEMARLHAELDRMQENLEAARRREQTMEQSRRELVAWVSHDLRTPLAGIRAVTEALEDGVVTDEPTVREYHSRLRREADRLSGLVDDLFELSRTQAGVLRLEFERVSLGDLVSDVVAGMAPVAEAKGVRLEGRLTGSAPDVLGSTPELLRALRNLLENAIRHTPSDGSVVVETGAEAAGRAYVSVVDSGGGIPPGDLDRVFETAFRGDAARTPGDGGAGLGLSIAKGLVEAHAGEISVENTETGARFTVRLPVAEGRALAVSADEA